MRKIFVVIAAAVMLLSTLSVNAMADAKNSQFEQAFEQSELKLQKNETAEEIIWRAYHGDAGAIALASSGYLTGFGGFPQNLYLAQAWSESYYGLTDLATERLITLTFGETLDSQGRTLGSKTPHTFLTEWELSQESVGFSLINEAGLVDANGLIDKLRQKVSADARLGESYVASKEKLGEAAEYRAQVTRTIRELRNRKMTESDVKILSPGSGVRALSPQALIRYVATDDDPKRGHPVWKLEHLDQFISIRDINEEPELSRWLTALARNEAKRLATSEQGREQILELIRCAHSGDTDAIRQVAMAHTSGELMKSYEMYFQWLTFGAVHHGDVTCMELLAEHFANNSYYSPGLFVFPMRTEYLWGKLAMHYGDKETKERMGKMLDLAEKKYTWSDTRSLDKAVTALIKNMEAGDGLIWIK